MLLNRSWGDCRGGEKGEEEQQQSIGNGGRGGGHLMAFQERKGEGCWQRLEAVDFELLFLGQINLQRENGALRIAYNLKFELLKIGDSIKGQ